MTDGWIFLLGWVARDEEGTCSEQVSGRTCSLPARYRIGAQRGVGGPVTESWRCMNHAAAYAARHKLAFPAQPWHSVIAANSQVPA